MTHVVSPKAKAATGVTGAVDVAEDPHQMARVTTRRLVHPDLALKNDGEVALCQKPLALMVIWRKTAEHSCITNSRSKRIRKRTFTTLTLCSWAMSAASAVQGPRLIFGQASLARTERWTFERLSTVFHGMICKSSTAHGTVTAVPREQFLDSSLYCGGELGTGQTSAAIPLTSSL